MMEPTHDDEAVRRVGAAVPQSVLWVCQRLHDAGHEAVTVGGAVRDALMGRAVGDWDVATSARPEQVVALFPRTIPTGLQHGTVTVLAGAGAARVAVEVTTYRGEGAYSDARRPDTVTFGVPLHEDLARRDLVVNAIAFDPVRRAFHDPYDGRGDLAARRLRAVGDPTARFQEDGLRVMRALRFAATLEFALEADTEAAIPSALGALRRVSQERVRVELVKLLGAPRPSRGLVIARRTGVLAVVLPELDAVGDAGWRHALAWVDRLDAVEPRLAALLAAAAAPPGAPPPGPTGDAAAGRRADAALRRLTCSNAERDVVVRLVRAAHAPATTWTEPALRRLLAAVGRPAGAAVAALWHAGDGDAPWPAEAGGALAARARAVLARGDALTAGELAVGGSDLMAALGMSPGPELGRLLAALLDRVLDEPALNDRDRLLDTARALRAGG